MNVLIALIIGLIAGLHTSTWGMYKDSIHEGFTWLKYFRSTIIGGIAAVAAERVGTLGLVPMFSPLDLTQAADIVVLYGVSYVVERTIIEFYKTFIRTEDQSKYFIPMQFHVQGKVVHSRWKRLLIGLGCCVFVFFVSVGIYALQKANLQTAGVVIVLIIGSAGGWLSAFGGAWKDAPIEGFELFKFFRSPGIALFYSILIAFLTDNYFYIPICGLGYTIGTIETYKTFFFPSKPRGKFAGKPIDYPEMLQIRQRFVPVYVLIWIAVITTFIIAFIQPHSGLI